MYRVKCAFIKIHSLSKVLTIFNIKFTILLVGGTVYIIGLDFTYTCPICSGFQGNRGKLYIAKLVFLNWTSVSKIIW